MDMWVLTDCNNSAVFQVAYTNSNLTLLCIPAVTKPHIGHSAASVRPILQRSGGVKMKNTWGKLSLQQAELWPSHIEQLVWNKS